MHLFVGECHDDRRGFGPSAELVAGFSACDNSTFVRARLSFGRQWDGKVAGVNAVVGCPGFRELPFKGMPGYLNLIAFSQQVICYVAVSSGE